LALLCRRKEVFDLFAPRIIVNPLSLTASSIDHSISALVSPVRKGNIRHNIKHTSPSVGIR
jgi:hypothetical protein